MRGWLFVWLVLVLAPSLAQAETPQERARAANKRAMSRYDAGDYEAALRLFERAYELYPEPKILFNLGQAHRKRGEWAPALDAYKAYLRGVPAAPNRADVEEIVAELEGKLQAERPPATEPAPTPIPPPALPVTPPDPAPAQKENWYEDGLGWTLVGAGVASAAVGAVFLVKASGSSDDLATTPESGRDDLRADIRRDQTLGAVGLAVGGALVAGGIVKLVLTVGGSPREVSVASDGRMVLLRGAF